MGRIIGVLTETGGIADELQKLYEKIQKKTDAIVIFEKNPKILVEKMFQELNNKLKL